MGARQKKVSVIITTKNNERTLPALLQSIKDQSYSAIETIVVDNKSTDRTPQIAKKYKASLFNKGPERSAQRNEGAKRSKGDYLLVLDSDMVLTPYVVKKCVQMIEKHPSVIALNIPEESIGEGFWARCKSLERSFYSGESDVSWMQGARFFRRKEFFEMKGYDEKNTGTEDFDLPQRIRRAYGNKSIRTVNALIYHDEGKLSLLTTLRKKYYYAKKLNTYTSQEANKEMFGKQANIFLRYKLFFSNPKKLFHNPLVGLGMLSMKTLEFAAGGSGYASSYLSHNKKQ